MRTLLPLLLLCLVPPRAAAAGSNPVEPLSNGLKLSMTGPQIRKAFGEPTERSFDARTFGYPEFSVNVGGRRQEIWHLTLKRGVRLSSGIEVGSPRSDVESVFGAADEAVSGPYKLRFEYAGGRVAKIRVDPSGESFTADPAKAVTAETLAPAEPASRADLVGTWRGLAHTIATIELRADGTYTGANGGRGTWKPVPDGVLFTGPLAAWDHGHGRLTRPGTLEFEWKDAKGYKYYFALGKR